MVGDFVLNSPRVDIVSTVGRDGDVNQNPAVMIVIYKSTLMEGCQIGTLLIITTIMQRGLMSSLRTWYHLYPRSLDSDNGGMSQDRAIPRFGWWKALSLVMLI